MLDPQPDVRPEGVPARRADAAWPVRVAHRVPLAHRLVAHVIGLGFRPEHVRTPEDGSGSITTWIAGPIRALAEPTQRVDDDRHGADHGQQGF